MSLVVTSSSGSVLAAYQVHSNGPAGGALLEKPEQSGDGGGGNSSEGGGTESGAGGQDAAREALDWIHSFHASSRAAKQ